MLVARGVVNREEARSTRHSTTTEVFGSCGAQPHARMRAWRPGTGHGCWCRSTDEDPVARKRPRSAIERSAVRLGHHQRPARRVPRARLVARSSRRASRSVCWLLKVGGSSSVVAARATRARWPRRRGRSSARPSDHHTPTASAPARSLLVAAPRPPPRADAAVARPCRAARRRPVRSTADLPPLRRCPRGIAPRPRRRRRHAA